jgi:transcriptional regulator with XRE-family HTH domain
VRTTTSSGLFPALLKHWRSRRGMSQLDLALTAEVSARHVSFLETGRAQPSREMVSRLAEALAVPMRDQNQLLAAAGLPEAFAEPPPGGALEGPLLRAVQSMLAHHEPYPMLVMNRAYDVLRMNDGAARLLGRFVAEPEALGAAPNAFQVLFDPRLTRPFVEDWDQVARVMLSRLHREALGRPDDQALGALLLAIHAQPGIPSDWRTVDLSVASEPFLPIRLRRGDLRVSFLTTVTAFNAPQNVAAEELRIECYYPLDEETRLVCVASDAPPAATSSSA